MTQIQKMTKTQQQKTKVNKSLKKKDSITFCFQEGRAKNVYVEIFALNLFKAKMRCFFFA